MEKEMMTDEQQQIKLLSQFYKSQTGMPKAKKTLVIYYIYDSLDQDEVKLSNMHVCAKAILNDQLIVEIQREEVDEKMVTRYVVASEQPSNLKINKEVFEMEPHQEANSLENICVYETDKEQLRVVVMPIHNDLIDVSKIKQEAANDAAEDIKKKASFKLLQGKDHAQAQEDWKKEKQRLFEQRCREATGKHLKMFKTEAFFSMVLSRTEKISIACFAEFSNSKIQDLEGYKKQFFTFFKVPNQFKPQYICHGYTSKNRKICVQSEKEDVTTIFSAEGKFSRKKFKSLDDEYYFPTENIRTKIYDNMQSNDNQTICKVAQDFVKLWNKITIDTVLAFVPLLKKTSLMLQPPEKQVDDVNASVASDLNTSKEFSKQFTNALTCQEILEKYVPQNLWLPKNERLQPFYNAERLKNIKVSKGSSLIPASIQKLVFLHFFYSTARSFLQRYTKKDTVNSNPLEMLLMWKEGLKDIYSLYNSASKTFLHLEDYQEFRCKDMERFFNFLCFMIDSMVKIRKITNRQIATASEIKANFEQLKFKKEKILSYIVRNKNNIKTEQQISYYDLNLLMMNSNSNQDSEKDLEHIFLRFHELRANRISIQYIHDHQQVVEAIKSYSIVCLKYKTLPQAQQQIFDILKIYARLARLLKIVTQEESAGDIYYKLRQHQFADKCYRQSLSKYFGTPNQKAQKLLVWGKKFEDQFQFDLALSYYRKAFSYAKDLKVKQRALKHKLDCNARIRRSLTQEEERMHVNFLKEEIPDLEAYTSHVDLDAMLHRLRVCLKWDMKAHCSAILVQEEETRDPAESFFEHKSSSSKNIQEQE